MLVFLLLPATTAAGNNTLADFGYYYAMEMPTVGLGISARTLAHPRPPPAADVLQLSTVCTQYGEPNASITVSYNGLAGSKPNDLPICPAARRPARHARTHAHADTPYTPRRMEA